MRLRYKVQHRLTGLVLGTYSTRKRARAKIEKEELEYGASLPLTIIETGDGSTTGKSIDPDELAQDALLMPPRCEVDTWSSGVVVRLVVV